MDTFIAPNNKILKKVSKKHEDIQYIWEPVLYIKYTDGYMVNEVIMDSFIPGIIDNPVIPLLLARRPSLFSYKDKPSITGLHLKHLVDAKLLIDRIVEVSNNLDDLKKKAIDTMKYEMNLNIDWGRYRSIFIYTERLMRRKQSVFPYLRGQTPESSRYTELIFLENIVRRGLGIKKDAKISVIHEKKLYYPLAITRDFTVYEIAWKRIKA